MNNPAKTILIVDDEANIRQSFVDFFEDNLWSPIPIKSAEEGLEYLNQQTVDAAIVDIRLGGIDGETFIKEAKNIAPNMVFLICTGSPEYEISPELTKLPCVSDHIFRKPVTDMEKLKKEILCLAQK